MKPSREEWIRATAAAALIAALVSGCASASGGAGPTTITLSGAFALYPMVVKWTEEYADSHPDVAFDIQAGGAGKGMSDMLAGAADIAMVSREVKPEEIAQGAFPIAVTKDAVVATLNANNPALNAVLARGLTPEAAAAIWLSGEAITWGEIAGTDDLTPINVYTRSDSAGAAEMWAKFAGGEAQEDLKGTGVNGDPALAEAVRQDVQGIGFNNIGFAYDPGSLEQVAGIRVIPLDLNGDGRITPDEDFYARRGDLVAAIADGRYPSPPARVLYLVTKGQPTPAVEEFLRWVLTEGQQFVGDAGYVQLPEAVITQSLGLLDP